MPIWRQRYQICPFFVRDGESSVTCEGIVDGALCVHRFKDPVAKRKHQIKYCETYKYKKCPWAAMLEQLADNEPEGKTTAICRLSDGCPYARPAKSCCRSCEFSADCPAPQYRCDNSPERCGFSAIRAVDETENETDGTLFDFL